AGDSPRQERLSGSRRAHQQHALRNPPAELLELLRLLQELDDFLQFFLGLIDARDVLERHLLLRARRQLCSALAERKGFVPSALHLPHDENPEADHQEDRGPRIEKRRPGTRCFRLRLNLDVFLVELICQAVVVRCVGAELIGSVARVAGLERARNLVSDHDDGGNLIFVDRLHELREGPRSLSLAGKCVREVPDEDPDHDEDHPEQQALEGRVQPRPPNRLTFKSITPRAGSVTRKSSATDSPTTHTILSSPSTTRGSESLISLGILRSTRKSWSFFRRVWPSGRNRSPGRRDRTASGSVSGSAAIATS